MMKSSGQSLGQVRERVNSEPCLLLFPAETRKTQLTLLKMLKESAPAQNLSLVHTSAFQCLFGETLTSCLYSQVLTIPGPQCPGYLAPSSELPDNWVSAAAASRACSTEQDSPVGYHFPQCILYCYWGPFFVHCHQSGLTQPS